MAKFCKYCGNEINNKICECQKNVHKEEKKEPIKSEFIKSSKKHFDKLIYLIKNIFIKPKETIVEFIEKEDSHLAIIILGLTSIILAGCTVIFLKEIYEGATQNSFLYYNMASYIKNINYFKTFIQIFLNIFLSYILLAITFNVGFEKINKTTQTFQDTIKSIAISVLEPTVLIIISIFLFFISYKIALVIILSSVILYIINLYQTFGEIKNIKSNHYNHIFVILLVLYLILTIYFIPNIF